MEITGKELHIAFLVKTEKEIVKSYKYYQACGPSKRRSSSKAEESLVFFLLVSVVIFTILDHPLPD